MLKAAVNFEDITQHMNKTIAFRQLNDSEDLVQL